MYNINEEIRKIRLKNNLTQTEFSGLLGVSHQTVSSWERGRTHPPLSVMRKISQIFNVSFSSINHLEETQSDRSHKKEKIANTFLCLLSKKNLYNITMADIASESGLPANQVALFFSTPSDILAFIASKIEQQILSISKNTQATNPFEMIADVILPVLYKNNHTLKILYSGNYANGEWLHFLEQRYIKWATPFFDDYSVQNTVISRSFAVELSVKMTLSIISTWLTQPIPAEPKVFRDCFLQLTKSSLQDIASF
ncbi:hypothetical protein GCM10025879_11240 [Leuconostoc litchii]|uniref:XRE family transcriptional regulator n=1 Tax=Leuconostoc litchii TaxID=1981069 RepID=A0A6P2CMD4_9LACO|nr:helix-turn-helix transcriptional regulator [Leuconostoc litchii]TYC46046.1 XRE family transcriptional regulator [Leuconostoc litchii]GMA69878.1 hypothetical protein GCM10025879_11240 [Leuconostoc litchii]